MGLIEEIVEQPEVLKNWLDTQLPRVQEIAQAVSGRDVEYVLLAARGTSDHAGTYAQYVWGSLNGLPVALATPSLFTMYAVTPRLRRALVVGISQSGESPDVVSVVAEGRRQGAVTLAITNVVTSPLARQAEFTIDVHAGEEKAVAATKTYTAELLAIAALSAALSGKKEHLDALGLVPPVVQQALGLERGIEEIAERYRALAHCVVLGRGYNYATAQEWALKLKELAYVFADPYSTADFLHGPIAIVEQGFPVLAIAPRGAVLEDLVALLRRLREEYRAELLVISDDEQALALGNSSVHVKASLPEWLTPLVMIVPAQLFCYHLTRAKGYDPQAPRGLRKVTRTL